MSGMSTTVSRRRPGRPPKSEAPDTKTALLDAAMRLFAERGYAGTSIRAIAREVGLSESVLYAHFSSKRAIYEAALSLAGPQAAQAASGLAPDDPAAFVRSFADALLSAWDTPQSRQVTSLVSRDGLLHDPVLHADIEDALTHLTAVFTRWLADGRIRGDLGEPGDLAYTLLAPIAHARMLWLHAHATPAQLEAARHRIAAHAAFFARAILPLS
uniref:TetR/AcrR family transcriptional regulator n=1 Tax=Nonomuraea sp. CA-252377 TaxID=3240003 RepID=UPI003F492198